MEYLSRIWKAWKKLSRKIADFQSLIILTLFYFLLAPFGLIFTNLKDTLKMKSYSESTWINKNQQSDGLNKLKQQY